MDKKEIIETVLSASLMFLVIYLLWVALYAYGL